MNFRLHLEVHNSSVFARFLRMDSYWQSQGYGTVPYGDTLQPPNPNWYASAAQGGNATPSQGDAGNGSGEQSNGNSQGQQNNQGIQTGGQTGVQTGGQASYQGQTTDQQNVEDSDSSEDEDPGREKGAYLAGDQVWWCVERFIRC